MDHKMALFLSTHSGFSEAVDSSKVCLPAGGSLLLAESQRVHLHDVHDVTDHMTFVMLINTDLNGAQSSLQFSGKTEGGINFFLSLLSVTDHNSNDILYAS